MAAIQYCDYPYDNHKIRFEIMREDLKNHRWTNLGFGLIVSVCTAIPIVKFPHHADRHLWRNRHVGRFVPGQTYVEPVATNNKKAPSGAFLLTKQHQPCVDALTSDASAPYPYGQKLDLG